MSLMDFVQTPIPCPSIPFQDLIYSAAISINSFSEYFFLEILDYSIHFADLDCPGIIQYPDIPSLDFDK